MTLIPAFPSPNATKRAGSREAAEAAGRRMAAEIPVPPGAASENPVEAMARAAIPRLREIGVVAEIVRVRRDCLVVRSVAADPLAVAEACALVGGWLEALPGVACGLVGTVAESTCATRGHRMCMHTLMWRAPAGATATTAAVELPTTLGPHGEGPQRTGPSPTEHPSPRGGPSPAGPALPEPLPDAASPLPIPAASGLAPATSPPASPAPRPTASLPGFGPLPLGPGGATQGEAARGHASAAAGRATAHQGAAQTGAVHNGAVHNGAVHNGAVHNGAVHNGAVHNGAVHNGAAHHGGAPPRRDAETHEATPHRGTAAAVRGVPTAPHANIPSESRTQPQRVRFGKRTASFGRAPWVRRRAWLLVVGLLAGSLGGYAAASRASSSYVATSVLEVQSSATTNAVSSANGAEELAVTYAALVPADGALLAQVGADVGTGPSAVGHSLSVEAVSGTALIDVRFSAATPTAAMEGANDVAGALTAALPPGHAITPGSLSLVSTAQKAARQGSLHKYGLPIGILLGLLVGAGATLVAERSDRRVDDVEGLSAAAGCSATAEPGGISPAELAADLAASGEGRVVFVPLGVQEEHASAALGMRVAQAWRARPGAPEGGDVPVVTVGAPFSSSPQALSAHLGSTVLVVAAGQRASTVQEAADRLRLLCHGPAWAVLVPRSGRVGPGDHGG